jgi:hypothetical protein
MMFIYLPAQNICNKPKEERKKFKFIKFLSQPTLNNDAQHEKMQKKLRQNIKREKRGRVAEEEAKKI